MNFNRYDDRPERYRRERNDCTVCALSNALMIPYEKAHAFLQLQGRSYGHGFRIRTALYGRAELLGHRITQVVGGFLARQIAARMRLSTFVQRFPEGNYIVRVSRHAFAVIDGVVVDREWQSERRIVTDAWRVEG